MAAASALPISRRKDADQYQGRNVSDIWVEEAGLTRRRTRSIACSACCAQGRGGRRRVRSRRWAVIEVRGRKQRVPGLLTKASVAIDGSKFKAVNTRDKNFTRGKVERRRAQLEKSVARYLAQLDTADLQEPSEELAAKTAHLKEKLVKLESEMQCSSPQWRRLKLSG
jgi:hypothetical protein